MRKPLLISNRSCDKANTAAVQVTN